MHSWPLLSAKGALTAILIQTMVLVGTKLAEKVSRSTNFLLSEIENPTTMIRLVTELEGISGLQERYMDPPSHQQQCKAFWFTANGAPGGSYPSSVKSGRTRHDELHEVPSFALVDRRRDPSRLCRHKPARSFHQRPHQTPSMAWAKI